MRTTTKILLVLLLFVSAALVVYIKLYSGATQEKQRLATNQRALFNEAAYYRTKSDLSAASIERLTLTAVELRTYCSELAAVVESLEIKLRRVQSASTTGITSNYTAAIPITTHKLKLDDDIFNTASRKAMRDALDNTSEERKIAYKTPYIDISGIIKNDSLCVDIQTFDTLTTIIHRVPRKFLFIKWGTKAIRQEVMSNNPHSTITYTEYIELKK